MGIDDAEIPVTSDDGDSRALNVFPMDDNDSVAGRMVPRREILQDENEGAPEVIPDVQDTQEVRDEEDEEAQANREYKAHKLTNAMRKLDTWYNPMSRSTKDQVEDDTDSSITDINFVHQNGLSSDFGEPKTFKEAWNGIEQEKWKPSMGSEVMNFLNRKAWTKITREKASKTGKKILKVKWVFKKKDEQDGSIRYKSRIVIKGYLHTTIPLLLAIALYK
jgi:hypothetical protein